jgi:hypothetical protein
MQRGTSGSLLLAAMLASAPVLAESTITMTRTDNGTTLPFQRHIVRLGPASVGEGVLVAVVQCNGSNGLGLEMYESTNLGNSWSHVMSVQPNSSIRDTADLLADTDGQGFVLAYGAEPVSSMWAPSSKETIVFVHYSLGSNNQIAADQGPTTVYTPSSSQGYFRPAITRDSTGTLHLTATLLDSNGNFSWWERMSIDGGQEWTAAEQIDSFGSSFGGGRTVAYGSNVMAIYDAYDPNSPGRYRTKSAGACSTWSSATQFVPEGLYHAGAFSVTSTPDGHVHLGSSDKDEQQLWYREFNGSSWSSRKLIESTGIWSNQPALSHDANNNLTFAWNHPDSDTTNEVWVMTRTGTTWSSHKVLDSTSIWDGYTSAQEVIVSGEPVQIIWSQGPADASSPMAVRDYAFTP